MADDEQSTSGAASRLVQDFIGRLRAATGRMENLTRSGGRLPKDGGPGGMPDG